jgi:hypothetical protein
MSAQYQTDMMEDIEMQLEELNDHSEVTQLEMLTYESEHIMEHCVQPSQEWYEARFLKIYQYAELNWLDFSNRYRMNSEYMADKAHHIDQALRHLIEEWGVSPIFDLAIYYDVLHTMLELWKYYESEYMDENHDEDVSDLIAGLKHL